jgi:hypothetical protein
MTYFARQWFAVPANQVLRPPLTPLGHHFHSVFRKRYLYRHTSLYVIASPATGHQYYSKVTSFLLASESVLMARRFRLVLLRTHPFALIRSWLTPMLIPLTTYSFQSIRSLPSVALSSLLRCTPHRCRSASPIHSLRSFPPTSVLLLFTTLSAYSDLN